MCPEHIEVIRNEAGKRSPVFLCNLYYDIVSYRGKTKKTLRQKAENIVCKGDESDIKNSTRVKRSCIAFYFRGTANVKKKTFEYDVEKIEIAEIEYIKHLTYGIK